MWAQVINALIGLWLMVAPAVLETHKMAANNDNTVGPLIISFAVISLWEATRSVRFFNIPLGIWLLAAPWVLEYQDTPAIVNDMVAGAVIIALSFVKGKVAGKYGGGWTALWKSDSLHAQEAKRQPRV